MTEKKSRSGIHTAAIESNILHLGQEMGGETGEIEEHKERIPKTWKECYD